MAAMALAGLARRSNPVRKDRHGWSRLRPGWLLLSTIGLAAVLSLICGYVWLFVGSARSDAETQMLICLLLAVAFGIMSFAATWGAFGRSVRWNEREIRIKRLFD